MFYFIPAWKNMQVSKTDEMLSQIKMFHSTKEEYNVCITSYMPYLRTFLLLEGIDVKNTFSVYDKMQNIHQDYENKVDIYNLKWPDDVSFVYSQFAIFVLRENMRYASVYFDALNNISYIDLFASEKELEKKIYFDDRGFISSIEFYKKNRPYKKEFYNERNELQFIIDYVNNNQIILGEMNRIKYGREKFSSIDRFIETILCTFVQSIGENDVIVISIDDEIVHQIKFPNQKNFHLISSVFSHRSFDIHSSRVKTIFEISDIVLADQQQLALRLSKLDLNKPIKVLTPYDTILRLGESQQVDYFLLHYVFHEEQLPQIKNIFKQILHWYEQNGWYFTIHCIHNSYLTILKQQFIQVLSEFFELDFSIIQELVQLVEHQEENNLDKLLETDDFDKIEHVKKIILHINFQIFFTKEDLLANLLHTRLIIDLGNQPDVLTQICGISSGIPMINRVYTGYVVHQKNGWIIKEDNELEGVLKYYLTGLKHWNEALVYSIAQLNKYTSGAIIQQWKEWLKIV